MDNSRLTKQLMYCEPAGWDRKNVDDNSRVLRTLKASMKDVGIDPVSLEDSAANRSSWRGRVNSMKNN